MNEPKTKIILNPKAGRGRARRVWDGIRHLFGEVDKHFSLAVSSYRGEIIELACRAADEGYTTIVAVGGDGTITETVNGIMKSGRCPALGIIPAGSGNDLIRTLEIPKSPEDAVQVVKEGRRRCIDLGQVNGRYFINISGVGVDAEVGRRVNEDLSFFHGTAAYVLGVLLTLISFRPKRVCLVLDGEEIALERMWVTVIGNGKFIGGGMKITPGAVINDGLFDICVVRDLSKFTLITSFPRIFNGSHVKLPRVDVYRAREVRIEAEEELTGQADGETMRGKSWTYQIIPAALNVIVP